MVGHDLSINQSPYMRFADSDSMHNTGYWVKYTNIRSLGFVWFSTHRRDLIPWSRFVLVVRG